MRIGAWHFTPGLWPTAATLVLLSLFVALGFWQLDRADQKSRKHGEFVLRQSEHALDLNDPVTLRRNKEELLWRRAQARGHFDNEVHILLDNQVLRGKAGYFVYTLFLVTPGDHWLLVNRGWVPLGKDRGVAPLLETPAAEIKIVGVINDVPATGLVLGDAPAEALTRTIYRAQRIDLDEIARQRGHKLLPFVLALAPESGHGFIRHWQLPGSGREKHLGYAFQWFLFAAILVVIYLAVNIKKITRDDD
ncbi:MAG: SURF1 family protein [Gammaproteobacteria bacterium]